MTDDRARTSYEGGRDRHRGIAARLEARGQRIATARLILAGTGIVIVGGIVWGGLRAAGWAGLGAVLVVFAALVVAHSRVETAKGRALAAARFHARGLARLDHAWSDLPVSSERFRVADHPFGGDLDVWGRASLMQLVDATETRFGEERLASWLGATAREGWPASALARAEAARELSSRLEFRESLAIAAGVLSDERPDPASFIAWAEESGELAPVYRWLGWGVPGAMLLVLALTPILGWPSSALTITSGVALALGILTSARLNPMLSAISARESAATRWRTTLSIVEAEPVQASLLVALKGRLVQGAPASAEMGALERIVGFVDARRNEAFRFFIGPFLMWDVHCAGALLRWRRRSGGKVRGWLEALGEVEALASLGGFAFEHPGFAWPSLVETPIVEAHDLGHPLIQDGRRVGNDVQLSGAGRALVVTGSNMSGKSTLLRAMGVNAVLAMMGAPVCARTMRIGPLRVATSMRVQDSLAHGVSHFYAELQRLKRVVDMAREPRSDSVLFLLDEILHGTNSRERVLGATAVVRDLLAHRALGAVSTHDLGITALERELRGSVENVHFEEQVEGTAMTFDYVLRPGVVQSSNALRLMRAIGLVAEEDGSGGPAIGPVAGGSEPSPASDDPASVAAR
jgi:hypothetical protein